ncbi:MAG: hypothetical protein KGV57_04280 [Fusobacterium sp.]|nr:hypothetical protein [Fusobacterium sp.]
MEKLVKEIFNILYVGRENKINIREKIIENMGSMFFSVLFLIVLILIFINIIIFNLDEIIIIKQKKYLKYAVNAIILGTGYFLFRKLDPYLYKLLDEKYITSIDRKKYKCTKYKIYQKLLQLWTLWFFMLVILFMKIYAIFR